MRYLVMLPFYFVALNLIAQNPELIFHSGFEPSTATYDESSSSVDLIGVDGSVNAPNDWENDLDDHPNIGYFKIQYKGGDPSERLAEIAPDPVNPSNSTLQFWIKEPNSGNNGRIQGNLYGNNGIFKLHYSVRLFLPGDFNILKNAPFDFRFMTLMEFWNNANWTDEDYMFRIKVNLQKILETPDSLYVRAAGQMRDNGEGEWGDYIWDVTNTNFVVPVQKWMTLRVYFVEGDECTGRFVFSIQPDGEAETIVHDIRDFTHHPDNPDPDGLTDFNPIKLYTDEEIVEYVTDEGGMLNVFWDDFEIWKDSLPVTGGDCYPNGLTFTSQQQIDDFAANSPICTRIIGDVTIESGSSSITNLNGLSGLEFIDGTLKITSNDALTSLEGLEELSFSCISGLEITNNPLLSTCNLSNICDYLDNDGPAVIANNADGCNNSTNILENCIYPDEDNDGFNSSVDCDDDDPDINPNATEIPNNGIDEDCDGEDLVTSIQGITESNIHVFPNPTNGMLTINCMQQSKVFLKIMDLTGKQVYKGFISGHFQFDLSDFSSNLFILSLQVDDEVAMCAAEILTAIESQQD